MLAIPPLQAFLAMFILCLRMSLHPVLCMTPPPLFSPLLAWKPLLLFPSGLHRHLPIALPPLTFLSNSHDGPTASAWLAVQNEL